MHRFSDFAKEDKPLEGQKRKVDEVLNQEICVLDARINDSKYAEEGGDRKRCATIQFTRGDHDELCVCFTGSTVLINQIEKYREYLPFTATIRKVDRYYTFS